MVLNNAIDSKEDGADIPKSKGMENTVNNPEENPSLASKMSDNSSEADFAPQTVVTWMMVSVAVGLLTIYTMIQLISNKLTQEIEHGKKTEGQVNQQHKNTTDLSNHTGGKHNATDSDNDLETPKENGNQSDNIYKGSKKTGESDGDLLHKNLTSPEDDTLNAEKSDFDTSENVEELENDGSCVERTECTECQSNGHATSIHMGAGFSGNVSIRTEASTENGDLVCCKIDSNTAENVPNCRSAATLENCNVNHIAPVTVNYLQTKCFSCNAEIPRNTEAPTHPVKQIPGSNKLLDTTELSEDLAGAKLDDEIPTENKIESPVNHPPCTIACMQTTVKSLSCVTRNDVPELSLQLHLSDWNKPNEISQSRFHAHFGLEDNLNPCQIQDNQINKAEMPFDAENIDLLHTTQSNVCTENKAATKTVSDSLSFLAGHHSPQETIDGAIFSKNSSQDEFMFPQDNATATEAQFTTTEEPETPRSRYLRYIRDDPALSKSLDSQMEILKKGCKLLEKKPAKSALRTSGSEECLKKFVHFPPDIRNIRKVHKYDSFDESCFDVEDSASNAEKQRTQSQSFDIFLRK
ncbi:Hypothetical predicted protein [Paramuricea clavata]|uniref:Uncharacterized protein n=1 Tax=Paramuricea clavata TaxID=317549 RepID=A0A6S7JC48_PARCT|nr:Hypothetical predicted protein [Paramuricea clavata]